MTPGKKILAIMNKFSKNLSSLWMRFSNLLLRIRGVFSKLSASTGNGLRDWLISKKKWIFGSGGGWSEVEAPITEALHGPIQTVNGPYVVSTSGKILRQTKGTWKMRTESELAANNYSYSLTTIDATSDGKRIWFVGSSGAFGAYDLETTKTDDYSAPKEKTSTWEAIAVTGETGNERLKIANSSGEILPVTTTENGHLQWGEVTKPGSGASITALDYAGNTCYAIDSSGTVFEETDDGWTAIGIKNAQVNFYDLCATQKTVLVAGSDGKIYCYDRSCSDWTLVSVGEEMLQRVDRIDNTMVAVGANGRVYQCSSQWNWTQVSSLDDDDLSTNILGTSAVTVGADGTIIKA
jgi:hypothetical protein